MTVQSISYSSKLFQKKVEHNLICLTIDVEWANSDVLADLVRILDYHKLPATFFCTHANINLPDRYERGLHPNFRRGGETLQKLEAEVGPVLNEWSDIEIYQYVVQATHTFCPEAIGVRTHSLFYDFALIPIYREVGLQYDSSYFQPMVLGLSPYLKAYNLLEIPIYYMDHFDLIEQATEFKVGNLHLDQSGIKVFDFHPNMVFINASNEEQYLDSKPYYHNYEQLLKRRYSGRGVRTLFLELLDFIATKQLRTATLRDVNTAWRTT